MCIRDSISDDMKEADALKFQKKLNEEPFVKETSYISKEQALKDVYKRQVCSSLMLP